MSKIGADHLARDAIVYVRQSDAERPRSSSMASIRAKPNCRSRSRIAYWSAPLSRFGEDLVDGGLPDVQDRLACQMMALDLVRHHRSPLSAARRPAPGGCRRPVAAMFQKHAGHQHRRKPSRPVRQAAPRRQVRSPVVVRRIEQDPTGTSGGMGAWSALRASRSWNCTDAPDGGRERLRTGLQRGGRGAGLQTLHSLVQPVEVEVGLSQPHARRARHAIIAHRVSAPSPQLRTLTRTASASSSNKPCCCAVPARIEEPP